MHKSEMIKILTEAKLLLGYQELTEAEFEAWFNYFGTESANVFHQAMKIALKSSEHFPNPGKIQAQLEAIKNPSVLSLTSIQAQALNSENEIVKAARDFADRVTPDNSQVQYSSPEELDRANQIRAATWNRNFKERFEVFQSEAKRLIRAGVEPELAMRRAIGDTSAGALPLEINRLVALAGGSK